MKKSIYWMRILALLALAGASLFACSKDDKELIEQNDVEVEFSRLPNGFDRLAPDTIRALATRPDVKDIYLVPIDSWRNFAAHNIAAIRENALEPAINAAPGRVFGRGDFNFKPGVVRTDDSLWIVKHGWTINQKQH